MADHEFKTRVSLDGGQEYSQQLKAAGQQLKMLQAELKAATSALGKNATEEQKNAVKIENLKKKIEQQKTAVAVMTKALNEAKAKYGENSAQVVQWQTRLYNAQATLNNMTNELTDLNNNLGKTDDAMKKAGTTITDTAQKSANMSSALSKMGDLAKSVSNDVKGVFDSMLNSVKGVVDEISRLIDVAKGKVNIWKGISDVYGAEDGSSVVGIQRMLYGAESVGIGNTEVQATIKSLVQRTDTGAAGVSDTLAALGIDEGKYTNHWDYYEAVLGAMAGLDRATQSEYARTLFGNGQYETVMSMMAQWGEMQADIAETDAAGGFLDMETISTVNQYSETLERLGTALTNLQTFIGADLIVKLDLTGISEDAIDVINSITALWSAITGGTEDEKREALIKFEGSVSILAQDLMTMITQIEGLVSSMGTTLSESENPILQVVGQILLALSDTLKWLSEWLSDPANKQIIRNLVQWFVKNKAVELVTGKSITGWLETIAGYLLQIATIVALLKGGSAGSSVLNALGIGTGAAGADAAGTGGAAALAKLFTSPAAGLAALTVVSWFAERAAIDEYNNHGYGEHDFGSRWADGQGDSSNGATFVDTMIQYDALMRQGRGEQAYALLESVLMDPNFEGQTGGYMHASQIAGAYRNYAYEGYEVEDGEPTLAGIPLSQWAQLWSVNDAWGDFDPTSRWADVFMAMSDYTANPNTEDEENVSLSSDSIESITSSFSRAVDGMQVSLDGQNVGRIVSRYIAAEN